MRKILVLVSCLLSCYPVALYACSISFSHPEYIRVVKIYGKTIEGLKLDPINNTLYYSGILKLSVSIEKKGKMEEIAFFENQTLCPSERASSDEDDCLSGYGIGLGYYFDLSRRKIREALFLKLGDSELTKYKSRDRLVRNTRKLRKRAESWAYHQCGDQL